MTGPSLPPPGQRGSLDQVARVQSSTLDGGPAHGMRVIDVSLADGLTFQVLPDRGLDIGAVWCAGPTGRFVPVSWTSRLGAHVLPLDDPKGSAWITRFSGGLLTTCGIDNVGPASEGVGLHGSFSHRRAHDVSVARRIVNEGSAEERVVVEISAVIRDADALSRDISVARTITCSSGQRSVRVEDVVTNHGVRVEPIPMLYHLNFGAPLWTDRSTVRFADGSAAIPRDDDAAADMNTCDFPGIGADWPERVYEQVIPLSDVPVTIDSPATGLVAELRWSQSTMSRCMQWIHPGAGVSALGIEPSNSSVLGRAHDRAEGRLPLLAGGASVTMWFDIELRPRSENHD